MTPLVRFLLVIVALAPILHRRDSDDAPVEEPPILLCMNGGGAPVEESPTGPIHAGADRNLHGQRRRAGRGARYRWTA